jgi:hypothetical protein
MFVCCGGFSVSLVGEIFILPTTTSKGDEHRLLYTMDQNTACSMIMGMQYLMIHSPRSCNTTRCYYKGLDCDQL